MPPPKALPGFYFDPDKNRYFPIKGRIPGSKRPSSSSSTRSDEPSEPNKKHHIHKACRRRHVKASLLLHDRELHGRLLISNNRRYNFEHEYEKVQAYYPMVWRYPGTSIVDSSLEQLYGIVQTTRGLERTDLLTVGDIKGSLRVYGVGNIEQPHLTYGVVSVPFHVWPPITKFEVGCYSAPRSISSSPQTSTSFSSCISHIQRIGKHSPDPADDSSLFQNALVTTLGSGISGGTVNILNLREPLDTNIDAFGFHRRTSRLVSSDFTIWTADCNPNGTQAVIGTNKGAALINLETGGLSWVYRTKSDIFSQQYDQLGNVVLCGLRNGSITAVDVRQKHSGYSAVSARPTPAVASINQTSHLPSIRHNNRSTRQNFELKRNLNFSSAVSMSSAVCSLIALQSDDQYFIGSSMDGYIKLFDRRLLGRGAVQSYDGHVNSHTHLQLGVNPSETLLVSGGEDSFARIWSIKTGELIFGENVANCILKTICWPRSGRGTHETCGLVSQRHDEIYGVRHSWGVWMGSSEGLFYMHGI